MFENLKKLKSQESEIKQLEDHCVELRISRDEVQHDLDSANERGNAAIKQVADATAERDKFKKLVREQTEADLLINALKAVGMIKDEKPCNYMEEGRRLMAQQQMAGARDSGMYYGGAQSGLRSIFGQYR